MAEKNNWCLSSEQVLDLVASLCNFFMDCGQVKKEVFSDYSQQQFPQNVLPPYQPTPLQQPHFQHRNFSYTSFAFDGSCTFQGH